MKLHIEKNTVQETLVIPLYGRLICSEHYPDLLSDPNAERICACLDYDFSRKRRLMETQAGLFGALEVAQRHYDLMWEVNDYLSKHPRAAVVNLGCGLDDTFEKVDNGLCFGYNIDLEDVIAVRNQLLPASEREVNIACDLNDDKWMDLIDDHDGVVMFATGVFYYFKKDDVETLFAKMAKRFKGGVLAFDTCNQKGAKMMMKTWLKEAGITDVGAFFCVNDESELKKWNVSSKSYMRGYRDIYPRVNLIHKLLIKLCDSYVRMRIIRIEFQ